MEKPPILNNEQANKAVKGLSLSGMISAAGAERLIEAQLDADLKWFTKWASEPCPHSTLPTKRKMCDACWQELEKLVEVKE